MKTLVKFVTVSGLCLASFAGGIYTANQHRNQEVADLVVQQKALTALQDSALLGCSTDRDQLMRMLQATQEMSATTAALGKTAIQHLYNAGGINGAVEVGAASDNLVKMVDAMESTAEASSKVLAIMNGEAGK